MTAIGATTASSMSQPQGSRVALRADLARYEKQLSDCVNCSSARTPEGKRNIQDLNARIGDLKARLNGVTEATPAAPSGGSSSATASPFLRSRIDVYA